MLLTWLGEDGVLNPQDVDAVMQRFAAGTSAQHPLVRLATLGLKRADTGAALELESLTEWLAQRVKLPYLRIDPLKVDVARVADVMSITYAERRKALPVYVTSTEVTIATSEPLDVAWAEEIHAHTRKTIQLVVANPLDLQRYRTEFYTLARSVKDAKKKTGDSVAHNFEQLVELGRANRQLDANDQGIIQVVDWLWQYAFDQRASDIHLEPRREMAAIRFRIDGVLHTVYQVPLSVMQAMIARIKLLGRMDVVEKRRPLDGRIKTRNPGGDEVEMRLSTMPTAFGEKMVMRIFDPDNTVKSVEALGFAPAEKLVWEQLLAQPHGIILVTGPTGSGKTTTLYAALQKLDTRRQNIMTVEDPIEYELAGVGQTQVNAKIDLDFAKALRAILRQDPDVIMIGEIRDFETAQIAIQASLTGHLVLATLHTNDAASAVTRLTDMGIEPFLLSSSLLGVLAQRLLRKLCVACHGAGCAECGHTGYQGRTGVFELLVTNDAIREQIHHQASEADIRTAAIAGGMTLMREDGERLVRDGITSREELVRVTRD